MTYLLFLKMAHERANRPLRPERIVPEEFSWQRLLDADGAELELLIKGDAYESLLAKGAEDITSGAGQYFTPRPLVQRDGRRDPADGPRHGRRP